MRLFTLALPLAAALVLVVPATAARKPPPTPTKFGTPVFVSTPSADGIHRDITLTVPFAHQQSVAARMTITVNGVLVANYGPVATYRGTGSETFRSSIYWPDEIALWPGDTVSYHLELVELREAWNEGAAILDEITTPTYVIT